MLIDLHVHTRRFSWDADLAPDDAIDLAKHAGLDAVCLTEHDFFWDWEETMALGRKHNFVVLPGVEINTDDGHMLCFGLKSYVLGMHRLGELATHLQRAGGASVVAHPYRRRAPSQAENRDPEAYAASVSHAAANPAYQMCSAVERLNGRGLSDENDFSAAVCDRVSLAATAGSDAHAATDIGTCATEFLDPIHSLEDLITALKAGRCRPVEMRGRAGPLRRVEPPRGDE